jgi:hypothetical protein
MLHNANGLITSVGTTVISSKRNGDGRFSTAA